MSELIPVSAIKDNLTECPICREQFDEIVRIPRHISCCVQSICQPCLDKTMGRNETLKCPMCHHQHHLAGGVKSLPKEPIILKILDHLKIQKRKRLSCTDCPESSPAVAQCDNCGIFLCTRCHNAHMRTLITKDHTTATLDEIGKRHVKGFSRSHQCPQHQYRQEFYCLTCTKLICMACTIVEHDKRNGHNVVSLDEARQGVAQRTDDMLKKLDEKAAKLNQALEDLKTKKKNIDISKRRAKKDIDSTFDDIIKQINQRRSSLLSEVEEMSSSDLKLTENALKSTGILLAKVRFTTEYTQKMRSMADKIEDLQFMSSSSESLTKMMEGTARNVEFDRTGVTFVPVHLQHLRSTARITGLVRKLTFSSKERPPFTAVLIEPAEFPQVPDIDAKLTATNKDIFLPYLELDSSTASSDVTVTDTVISNIPPNPPPPDTGCRIHEARTVMTSRPLVVKRGQRLMLNTRITGSIKKIIDDGDIMFEVAVTDSPVDGKVYQPRGLSVQLAVNTENEPEMCLTISYDGEQIADVPMYIENIVRESFEIQLCFLLQNNKIHVIDAGNHAVLTYVKGAAIDRPLWVMMFVEDPSYADMHCELTSGNNVTNDLTRFVYRLLR